MRPMTVLPLIAFLFLENAIPATASASGCPDSMPDTEEERLGHFFKIHSAWPPTKEFPGGVELAEAPQWSRYMKEKEAKIKAIEDR